MQLQTRCSKYSNLALPCKFLAGCRGTFLNISYKCFTLSEPDPARNSSARHVRHCAASAPPARPSHATCLTQSDAPRLRSVRIRKARARGTTQHTARTLAARRSRPIHRARRTTHVGDASRDVLCAAAPADAGQVDGRAGSRRQDANPTHQNDQQRPTRLGQRPPVTFCRSMMSICELLFYSNVDRLDEKSTFH